MNTAQELLNAIKVQNEIEKELETQCLSYVDELVERKNKVASEWKQFIDDAFPEEILQLIRKDCCGKIHNNEFATDAYYLDICCSCISLKAKINNKWVYFYYRTDTHTISHRLYTDEWKNTAPALSSYARDLDAHYKALERWRELLPEIYRIISEEHQKKVNVAKNSLETICNTKIEKPKKKYKIEITVEE